MGVVHHSNYLRWFENARIAWLDRHDQAYADYVAAGRHFAVTRVEVDYHAPARFDDRIEITTWLEDLGAASLRMAYRLTHAGVPGKVLATGATEHAAIDHEGRVRRIPKERRARLSQALIRSGEDGT